MIRRLVKGEDSPIVKLETFIDKKEIAYDISDEALLHGAASTHIDKVSSSYLWGGKITDSEEYRVEILTQEYKVDELVDMIKKINKEGDGYQIITVSLVANNLLVTPETRNWIREEIKR